MKLIRYCSIVLLVLWSAAAWGATFGTSDVITREFPIDPDGTVWVDNIFGNVEIIAADVRSVTVVAQTVVNGVDRDALAEGRQAVTIHMDGDNHKRVFRTVMPLTRSERWRAQVLYRLTVPKSVTVHIDSSSSERLHISNIAGPVRVKNINGAILFDNVSGQITADSINGTIIVDSSFKPSSDMQLTTVNGNIQMLVPQDSAFRWIATTLRGDVLTNLPAHGRFLSTTYRGNINASRGPTITTAAYSGNVWVVRKGSAPGDARSVRVPDAADSASSSPPQTSPTSPTPRAMRTLQVPQFDGAFSYSTPLPMDITVGQVRGSAKIETGAGEVHIASVLSDCIVTSLGGPLTLGDIFGALTASTRAGDVLVNAARSGGGITTGGGMIRVLYAGGAMNLRSAGGDVILRLANGPVTAETRSGDISVNMAPNLRHAAVDLKSSKGSVALGISAAFAGDVDATLVTSDPDANTIHSDFNGLSVRREEVGGKTRIRATGKINGGGEKVVLYAEDGDIFISLMPTLRPNP